MIIVPEQLKISHVVSWSSRSPSIIELHWEIARGKESYVVACTEAKGSSSPLRPRPRGLSSRSRTHEMHVVAKSRALTMRNALRRAW